MRQTGIDGGAKMKKAIVLVMILTCSAAVLLSACVQLSYHPMGGEVTVIAKQESWSKYYITIQQGKPNDAGRGQFLLKCTQEQYSSVDIGDVIGCDRYQSALTHRGTVYRIHN